MGLFRRRIRTWIWAAALCLLFASFPASVHAQGTQTDSGQDSRTGMQTDSGQID